MQLANFLIEEAKRQGLDPNLALRVMKAESGGNPNALSPKGAYGPMQLMPRTAKEMGVDINDPYDNIRGGIKYLKRQRDAFGDDRLALAAYNAGAGAVKKYGGVPPYQETQKYVNKIAGGNMPRSGFNGADIFGTTSQKKEDKGGFNGADIFGDMTVKAEAAPEIKPEAKISPTPLEPKPAISKESWSLLNSPIGGIIRGLRDIPDAGAQLITRGLEAVAPAGSDFEKWAKAQREEVEGINKEAEREYKEDWRKGGVEGIDWGRLGGNILGGGAAAKALTLNPATLGGGVASGVLGGALNPVYDSKDFASEKTTQALLGGVGGAAGSALGALGSRLIKPIRSEIDEGGRLAREAANRLGVTLTPGQETGNQTLLSVERLLSKIPGSSGSMQKILKSNEKIINKAAARTIGESVDNLAETVMSASKKRLGDTFEDLSERSKVIFNSDFMKNLIKIDANNKELGSFASSEIDTLVDKGLELASRNQLAGPAYQKIRSKLTEDATNAFKAGNSDYGRALKSVRNSLDGLAKEGLSDADKAAWDTVRREYANFKTLSSPRVIEAGNVKPGPLTSELRRQGPDQFATGAHPSPLIDIARLHEGLKSTVVPSSNTSELGLMQSIMFGNPIVAGKTLGIANLLQKAMFSPAGRAYLNKGLLPYSFGAEQALRGTGALGGAGLLNSQMYPQMQGN